MMNVKFLDKKYQITDELDSCEVYYHSNGWALCEGNRLYLTDVTSDYMYDFYIIPSDEFMELWNNKSDIERIDLLESMQDEGNRMKLNVNTIVFSPEYRYQESDYEVVHRGYNEGYFIKIDELGCRNLYKSDRYVDGLYWDNETDEYVDDEGVPYDFEVIG